MLKILRSALLGALLMLAVGASAAQAVTLVAQQPSVLVRPNSAIEDVVVRGSDDNVYYKSFDGSNWGQWTNLGGPIKGKPTIVSYASNHIDILARDISDRLMHKFWNGSAWSGWISIAGSWQMAGDPAVVSWGYGREDVFARGTDGALIHAYYGGGNWSPWESLGGSLSTDPSPISLHAGHLDIFSLNTNGTLWHRYFDAGWSGWSQLFGWQYTSQPVVNSWGGSDPSMDVFARGTDGLLDDTIWFPSSGWYGPVAFGKALKGAPAVTSMAPGMKDVFVRAPDDTLHHLAYYNQGWNSWAQIGLWQIASQPNAIGYSGHEDVFAIGTDGKLIHVAYYDGAWHEWSSLGMPSDPYPTSTQYGGSDGSVNTAAEQENVFDALPDVTSELTGDWSQSPVWTGLKPDDQDHLFDAILSWSDIVAGASAAGASWPKLGFTNKLDAAQTQSFQNTLTNVQLAGGACSLLGTAVSNWVPNLVAKAVAKVVSWLCGAGALSVTAFKSKVANALSASTHPGVIIKFSIKAAPIWRNPLRVLPSMDVGPWN